MLDGHAEMEARAPQAPRPDAQEASPSRRGLSDANSSWTRLLEATPGFGMHVLGVHRTSRRATGTTRLTRGISRSCSWNQPFKESLAVPRAHRTTQNKASALQRCYHSSIAKSLPKLESSRLEHRVVAQRSLTLLRRRRRSLSTSNRCGVAKEQQHTHGCCRHAQPRKQPAF